MRKYPKTINPLTGKPFKRGEEWPFIRSHPVFGDESKCGLKFKQYCLKKRDPNHNGYAYMHWVNPEILSRNKFNNNVAMRRNTYNNSVENLILTRTKKIFNRQFPSGKPSLELTELYSHLLGLWNNLGEPEVGRNNHVRICPLLGKPMILGGSIFNRDDWATVHRIDNTKGYSMGNLRWISYRANRVISNITSDEILLIARNLKLLLI